jgi:hypothetical protein
VRGISSKEPAADAFRILQRNGNYATFYETKTAAIFRTEENIMNIWSRDESILQKQTWERKLKSMLKICIL